MNKITIKDLKEIFSTQSKYQKIQVFEAEGIAKALVLDDEFQFSDIDEYVYHEAITKVPFSINPNANKILVIGGGDGGTVRECLKFNPTFIDLCELDKSVVDTCKEYFSDMVSSLENEKVTVFYQDGKKFVKETEKKYDLIIVDSTDPFLSSVPLFDETFYKDLKNILTEDGVIVSQIETVTNSNQIRKNLFDTFNNNFKFVNAFAFSHVREFRDEKYNNLFSIVSDKELKIGQEIQHYFDLDPLEYDEVIDTIKQINWLKNA